MQGITMTILTLGLMSSRFSCKSVLMKGMILKSRWKRPNKILVCVSYFSIQICSVYVWISSFLTILNVSGRKDIKAEFGVMSSALSKEMGMMETQLKRWKDAALEAVSLREKAHSLRAKLSGKVIHTNCHFIFFLNYFVIGLLHKFIQII